MGSWFAGGGVWGGSADPPEERVEHRAAELVGEAVGQLAHRLAVVSLVLALEELALGRLQLQVAPVAGIGGVAEARGGAGGDDPLLVGAAGGAHGYEPPGHARPALQPPLAHGVGGVDAGAG